MLRNIRADSDTFVVQATKKTDWFNFDMVLSSQYDPVAPPHHVPHPHSIYLFGCVYTGALRGCSYGSRGFLEDR